MSDIETILGYRFSNDKLLTQALTHSSAGKAARSATLNNQRLEFLGDAVLGMVVSHLLYETYPDENEGDLARRLSALVNGETLARVSKSLGLGPFITMSNGEQSAGGRDNPAILEDVLEALIGAMYLDGGMKPSEQFILTYWRDLTLSVVSPPKDAKTGLQEWAQAHALGLPVYTLLATEGPAHAPLFTVQVKLQDIAPASASAASKRAAEQLAAAELLEYIKVTYA